MSSIGKNIKRIRGVRKLSQAKFAELFDLARPSVGAYEEGRAEPKIQTVIEIAHHFGIPIGDLLTKELNSNELYSLGSVNSKLDDFHGGVRTKERRQGQAIPLVTAEQYSAYEAQHKNDVYVSQLPTLSVPLEFSAKARAFEMLGHHMELENAGLQHGDLLICEKLEEEAFEEGKLIVAISVGTTLIGRVGRIEDDQLTVKFDNPRNEPRTVSVNTISEFWAVKALFTTNLIVPKRLEDRVVQLEGQLKALTNRLDNIENKRG